MAKSVVTLFDVKYAPHKYLSKAITQIANYCLPYGQVRIVNPETGIIIALILYIIAKEPTVNHTKLECYIILLNKMVNNSTGQELFTWQLNNRRRIGNFRKFLDYMTSHGLIKLKGRSNLAILSGARNLLLKLPLILSNLLPYLSQLLTKYENYTAGAMLIEI